MKKALQMTLSGVLFTIEEDAYDRLHAYLEETKEYFSTYNDGEIMKDIEARIAEQLMDKKDSIIIATDIDRLIATMGRVEDFKSEDRGEHEQGASPGQEAAGGRGRRKLFRNPDDVVIAGVASGIAAYFAIDPLIIRLIFIVLAFGSGGTGLVIYIILALILPKAVTPAEKLQMYGGPVSLDSFKKNMSEHTDNLRKNGRDLYNNSSSGLRNLLESLINLLGKLVRTALKIVVAFSSAIALAASALIVFGATFAFVNLIFNINSPYIEVPITQAIGIGAYYALLVLGYAIAIIPAIFVIGLIVSFFRRKFVFTNPILLGLGGAWMISAIVFGTLLIHYMPQIRQQIETMPQYQTITRTEELSGFTKLDIHDYARVHLVQSPAFSVVAQGPETEISGISFKVEDGTLVIGQSAQHKFCFICIGGGPSEITIGMPTTTSIALHDAVTLDAEALRADDIVLVLDDASRGKFNLSSENVTVTLNDASRLTLEGSTTALTVTTHDASRFDGFVFASQNAIAVSTDVSRIDIDAADTLQATASDIGRITYGGNPRITIKTSDGGKVRPQDGSDADHENTDRTPNDAPDTPQDIPEVE